MAAQRLVGKQLKRLTPGSASSVRETTLFIVNYSLYDTAQSVPSWGIVNTS